MPNTKKIWLVRGDIQEPGIEETWIVRAFETKESAGDYCGFIIQQFDDFKKQWGEHHLNMGDEEYQNALGVTDDPDHFWNWRDYVEYTIQEVELFP